MGALPKLTIALALVGCTDPRETPPRDRAEPAPAPVASASSAPRVPAASAPPSPPPSRPWPGSTKALIDLVPFRPGAERAPHMRFLERTIRYGKPAYMNQGNPAIADHAVSRARCEAGLTRVTLQTSAQRELCGGHANMVPIYEGGDVRRAKTCIDIFEFPNRPCELPFVWSGAGQARQVCKRIGKRLCSQDEWQLACAGDPEGGQRWRYSYGNRLDIEACNTGKSHRDHVSKNGPCNGRTAQSAWATCGTNTEPSGSFPRCRSRFGVYDLQGNVAEAMTRRDRDGKTYSQLKGSAFFYVDVQRPEGGERKRGNYPDTCGHDPRWHVQPIARAWHVNYHLGFRCCYSVRP